MQTTIILTRKNSSVPWGFRLKGGSEYNAPLSILKVNEESPSYGKLDCGDTLLNIGKFSALNLRHEEALHLIRMFDNSLPLIINRQSYVTFEKQHPSAVWRPQLENMPINKASPQNTNDGTTRYTSSNYQVDYQSENQPFLFNESPKLIQVAVTSEPPPPPPPLPPPSFNTTPIGYSQENHKAYLRQQQQHQSDYNLNNYLCQPHVSGHERSLPINSQQCHTVPNVLAKVISTPGGGRKPFTYTPGGLDLSHIRQSARVKRYESDQESNTSLPRARTNSYSNQQQDQQHAQKQNNLTQYKKPLYQPSNNTPYTSYLPKAYVQKHPYGLNVTSEDLQKSKDDKKDGFMNQSFSFRMLNKWIQESESTSLLKSKKDEELEKDLEQNKINIKSEVAKAIEEENNNLNKINQTFQYQQQPNEPESIQTSYNQSKRDKPYQSQPRAMPSKVFQILEKKYSLETDRDIETESDATTLLNVPAREQENESKQYKGTNIPSKTFKMLQFITNEDEKLQKSQLITNSVLNSSNENLNKQTKEVDEVKKENIAELEETQSAFQEQENFEQERMKIGNELILDVLSQTDENKINDASKHVAITGVSEF